MKQKSIVLVTVDCLRADHVGFMGYERPTTPFLDSLAGESFVFPAAIVAGAPTYYSFPAILASRYPLALGRDVLGLGPDEPTLASTLKQAGYATASFGAANPYISARFGYEHGFDTFRDFLEDEPAPLPEERVNASIGNGWASRLNRKTAKNSASVGASGIVYDELYFEYCQRVTPVADSLDALRRFPAADVIVDHACTWLASVGDAPFFLWLHLMDPHSPYYPKDAALTLMGEDPVTPYRARYLNSYWNRSDLGPRRFARHRDEVVALYDAGVRWVDEQMARLIEDAACVEPLGRLHLRLHRRPWRRVSRSWWPLSSAVAADGRIDSCAAAVARARQREKRGGEIPVQHDASCANAIGCGAVARAHKLRRPQPLGTVAAGCEFRRNRDLGVRGGLHQSLSSGASHGTARVVGQGIALQTRAAFRSSGVRIFTTSRLIPANRRRFRLLRRSRCGGACSKSRASI